MKKVITILICIIMLLSLGAFSGCSSQQQESANQRIVIDMQGKEITIPNTVGKYCILYSSAVPMCGMLDEGLVHMVMCPTLYAGGTYRWFPG